MPERARSLSEVFTSNSAKGSGIRFLVSGAASLALDIASWKTSHNSGRELILVGLLGFEPLRQLISYYYFESLEAVKSKTPKKSFMKQLEENIFETPRR